MRARVAAALHTQRDPRETTAAARRASLERYEKQVDPEGILPAKERKRRAKAAQKRQMQAMAYRSARARRQPKTRQQLQPGWQESFGGKIHRAGILKRRASTTRKTNLRRALTQSLNFAPWRAASLALLGPYSGRFRGASVKSARASALMKHPLLCNRSIVTTWS